MLSSTPPGFHGKEAVWQRKKKEMPTAEAVEECIEKGILRDFLLKNKAEKYGLSGEETEARTQKY